MDTGIDGWSDPRALRRRLDNWWVLQRSDRRRQILAAAGNTLPEWLAQSLIRAGLPLQVNPGFPDPSLTGQFVTPPLVREFFDEKRVQVPRKWWHFWR